MIQIRKNVFETNSSSSHSISISDSSSLLEIVKPNIDNKIIIDCNYSFDWGYAEYNDFMAKAAYLAIDNECLDGNMGRICEVIMEQTGCDEVIFNHLKIYRSGSYDYGYIDHQSQGTSQGIASDKELIRKFLFDKNSIIFIDNDNH